MKSVQLLHIRFVESIRSAKLLPGKSKAILCQNSNKFYPFLFFLDNNHNSVKFLEHEPTEKYTSPIKNAWNYIHSINNIFLCFLLIYSLASNYHSSLRLFTLKFVYMKFWTGQNISKVFVKRKAPWRSKAVKNSRITWAMCFIFIWVIFFIMYEELEQSYRVQNFLFFSLFLIHWQPKCSQPL